MDLATTESQLQESLNKLDAKLLAMEKTLEKRRLVIRCQKQRSDYLTFKATVPRHLRTASDPKTPSTHEIMPKRQWETQMRQWREGLRDWHAVSA